MDIDIMKMDREIREERRNKLKEDRHYCVYVHTCRDNWKMYVGMTKQDPQKRWKKDGKGYKSQIAFWRAIQAHGWDNFDHEIIASRLTEQEARDMERTLIDKLDLYVDHGKGYNLVQGGSYNGRNKADIVYCFDLDGNLVESRANLDTTLYERSLGLNNDLSDYLTQAQNILYHYAEALDS